MIKNKHNLFTDISGNNIAIKSYTFGKGDKAIYIQGGIHAGEITYFIFSKLYEFLSKHENLLNSKICLIPNVNPPGWNQRIYYYTAGKFDFHKGKDWNRSYPGNKTNLSARNSEVIYNLNKDYDLCIDLHTSRISKPYTIFSSDNVKDELKVLNFKFNVFVGNNSKFKGMFQQTLADNNRKGLTIECGSHDDYNEEDINEVFKSLVDLFIEKGVIHLKEFNKCKSKQENLYKTSKIDVLYNDHPGFIQYLVKPRQTVKKDEILAIIYSSKNLEDKIEIKCPFNGIIFELSKSHIVWLGDELFRIINFDNLIKL